MLVVFLSDVLTTRLAAPTIVLFTQRSFVSRARFPLVASNPLHASLQLFFSRFKRGLLIFEISDYGKCKEPTIEIVLSCNINQNCLTTRYCRAYWKLSLKLQRVVEAKFCSIKNKERRTMEVGRHRKTLRINNRE